MGTRSLTFVYDGIKPVINLYRQFDGYREGHGRDLANFLDGIRVVNGLGDDTKKVANGMGCLAAQLVAHFKVGAGGFYLYPTDTKDCWQDYEYHIYEKTIHVTGYDKEVFSGTWQEFIEWARAEETEEQE